MSEAEFKLPRKFTFDEYYELLKEYVNDPEAREALVIYDAEYKAGRGWGHAEFSKKAHKALGDFKIVGWNILAKHGWPNYKEAIELRKQPGMTDLERLGYWFVQTARRLSRKEPGTFYPGEEFQIGDKASVTKLLTRLLDEFPDHQPFTLPEDK